MNDEFQKQSAAGDAAPSTPPQAEKPAVGHQPSEATQNANYAAQPNYGYPYAAPTGAAPQAQPSYADGYYRNGPANQPGNNPNYMYYNANAPVPPKKPKKHLKDGSQHKKTGLIVFLSILAACLITVTIVAIVAVVRGNTANKTPLGDVPNAVLQDTPIASETEEDGALTAKGVYETVKESSVGILVYASNAYNNAALSGEGSGIIVGTDATNTYTYVLTCAHVINGGGAVKVQLYDETQYDASIVGFDSRTDIGVLRIRATGLSSAQLGNSANVSVGETVYAIGNPGGVAFAGSFTNGMVSAISRPIDSDIGYEMQCIQHTAAINPGNSGGALVNAYGQVIGMNSSKIASTEYEGMGFAVPSETLQEVFTEIVKNGYVTNRAKLGITYFPATSVQMYSMLVGANHLPAGTLIIQSVSADSDLANKDVKQGDMITKVNGKDLDSADMLADMIEKASVGDHLTLTINRVDTKNNYALSEFELEVELVEDRGTAQNEPVTQSSYYNPFGAYGYGN